MRGPRLNSPVGAISHRSMVSVYSIPLKRQRVHWSQVALKPKALLHESSAELGAVYSSPARLSFIF